MKIGVLASHHGTTLQALLDACASKQLAAEVAVVISNNRSSGALRRAAEFGVPAHNLSGLTHPDPTALDEAICATLERYGVAIVFLAGFMKKVGPAVLAKFAGRILNTHPALLPKFGGRGMYGRHVHEAVLEAKETETGVSVHIADAEYDTGPVIAQCVVSVEPDDTPESLAHRVQERERAFVVEVLAEIATGHLRLGDDAVGVR